MATATEVMKNFFKVLEDFSENNEVDVGVIALNKAVRAVSMENDLQTSINNFTTLLVGDNVPGYSELDSNTRLQTVAGVVIGAKDDYSADTGAIIGSNAGGSVVKNAADIVPESGDLSTATLPEPGSTTQITYTGDDGKSFTFNVKWPRSFTEVVSGSAVDSTTAAPFRLLDDRFLVDLNNFDENEQVYKDDEYGAFFSGNATYGDLKKAELTILKGLNTYWLKESAKLIYDSYGLDFDGKTIEIKFTSQGIFSKGAHYTTSRNNDDLPTDNMIMGINLSKIDENNPNGLIVTGSEITLPNGTTVTEPITLSFLDRIVAHEMVHAAMLANGTLKFSGMPQFFYEGVADLIQGDDDYNAGHTNAIDSTIKTFFENPDTLKNALSNSPNKNTVAYYPAGDIYLRYLAKNASEVNIFVGTDENKNQSINFDGNNTIITNYDESNTINYNTDFSMATTVSNYNDFAALNRNENAVLIRDVRGKMMNFANDAGGKAYAYMADAPGEVDGRNFDDGNSFEVIFGVNNKDNVIRAGNGGSYLWGGFLSNDELYGGAGVDKFVYDIKGGNDTVHDAESQDFVVLKNVDLTQITSAQILDNGVNLSFTYGGTLKVEGTPTNFVLENSGATYTADYQNKTWNSN